MSLDAARVRCDSIALTVQPASFLPLREKESGLDLYVRLEIRIVVNSLKPVTDINEHIARLRGRGMVVDKSEATQWLKNVSYYRLSAYWYPARVVPPGASEPIDNFVTGTSFSDVVKLYEADRKLRTLIHDGMERIEVAIRTQTVELLCRHDPTDPAGYLSSQLFRECFDHVQWVARIYGRLARAKKSDSVKHYSQHYGGKFPLWVVAEFMDFSDVSILYRGLRGSDQQAVAENLGLKIDTSNMSQSQNVRLRKGHPFASWLEQLTIVRNTCAHHGRLWNKSFVPASTLGLHTNGNLSLLPQGQSERVFGTLVMMSHLLREVSPGTTWPDKVLRVVVDDFLSNPLVQQSSLGISTGWDQVRI